MLKNLSKYLLFISIATFITVFIFIVQESYDKLISTQKKISADTILKPINPVLDTSILDVLEKKQEYQDDTSLNPTIEPTLTPTP